MIDRLITVSEWPYQGLVLPRLQAHRGYWLGGLQENTLDSIREARRRGALMYECDLRLSKDQVPVLFHDEDLQRLAGRSEKVSELTARELKEIANVPSLKEVLHDPQCPRFANLELKSKQKLDDPLERKTAEVVKAAKAESRVLFSSFNPMSLYRVSLHLPDVPRALLVSEKETDDNPVFLRKMWLAPFFSFHCLNLEAQMVTEERMAVWRQRKIPVAVWTVNGKDDIQKYLRMGALSVITDQW